MKARALPPVSLGLLEQAVLDLEQAVDEDPEGGWLVRVHSMRAEAMASVLGPIVGVDEPLALPRLVLNEALRLAGRRW